MLESSRQEWQCLHCYERHSADFDTCWNCGRDREGNADPDFQVFEPHEFLAVSADSTKSDLHDPKLPAISYFFIPVLLWLMVVSILDSSANPALRMIQAVPRFDEASDHLRVKLIAAIFYLLHVCVFILVVIPAAYAVWRCIANQQGAQRHCGPTAIVRLGLLPESLRTRCPLLVPLYYGSWAAVLFAIIAKVVWTMVGSLV